MSADSTMDAIALVLAVREGDTEGRDAILANCDGTAVTVALARLLAAVLAEQQVPAGQFRIWGQQAIAWP